MLGEKLGMFLCRNNFFSPSTGGKKKKKKKGPRPTPHPHVCNPPKKGGRCSGGGAQRAWTKKSEKKIAGPPAKLAGGGGGDTRAGICLLRFCFFCFLFTGGTGEHAHQKLPGGGGGGVGGGGNCVGKKRVLVLGAFVLVGVGTNGVQI